MKEESFVISGARMMMSELSERLSNIREDLKHTKGLQNIRTIVTKHLKCKPSEIRSFHFKMNGHDWTGVIYLKRNSLMGSIFSLFDSKSFVIRGYPKIRYSLDTKVIDKEVIVQAKYDGTNIGLFLLPNGEIMGKTRLMPRWDVQSLQAMKRQVSHWKELFTKIDNGELLKKIERVCKDDYLVFGELYGYLNRGEFIQYSIPIAFKVFDVVDTCTLKFLNPIKSRDLCQEYDIPFVEEMWSGILTRKQIERIEYEAKEYLGEDGYEGFVAKHFSNIDMDVHFCKLKCDEIKEKSWKIASKGIPVSIIYKAVRKAKENYPHYSTPEQLYPIVKEELAEDIESDLIEQSENKIRSIIRHRLAPTPKDLKEVVRSHMVKLRNKGMDLSKKAEVLSSLAASLGDISGSLLYRVYVQCLYELEDSI